MFWIFKKQIEKLRDQFNKGYYTGEIKEFNIIKRFS